MIAFIILNVLFIGLAIASMGTVLHKLRAGQVQQSGEALMVGCCGCSGSCSMGDPCTSVGLIGAAFGISIPLGLVPVPIGAGLQVALSNGLVSAQFIGGYGMICAGIVCQLVGLIFACIARDAYRSHAFTGFVRANQQQTTVIMQGGGYPQQQFPQAGYPQQMAPVYGAQNVVSANPVAYKM
jgi:hypothetical protein